jgi:hypothetical protein
MLSADSFSFSKTTLKTLREGGGPLRRPQRLLSVVSVKATLWRRPAYSETGTRASGLWCGVMTLTVPPAASIF